MGLDLPVTSFDKQLAPKNTEAAVRAASEPCARRDRGNLTIIYHETFQLSTRTTVRMGPPGADSSPLSANYVQTHPMLQIGPETADLGRCGGAETGS